MSNIEILSNADTIRLQYFYQQPFQGKRKRLSHATELWLNVFSNMVLYIISATVRVPDLCPLCEKTHEYTPISFVCF